MRTSTDKRLEASMIVASFDPMIPDECCCIIPLFSAEPGHWAAVELLLSAAVAMRSPVAPGFAEPGSAHVDTAKNSNRLCPNVCSK